MTSFNGINQENTCFSTSSLKRISISLRDNHYFILCKKLFDDIRPISYLLSMNMKYINFQAWFCVKLVKILSNQPYQIKMNHSSSLKNISFYVMIKFSKNPWKQSNKDVMQISYYLFLFIFVPNAWEDVTIFPR